jgi:hypothetical protein
MNLGALRMTLSRSRISKSCATYTATHGGKPEAGFRRAFCARVRVLRPDCRISGS